MKEVVLACAADDSYAMPMGVMIRSVLEHLGPGRTLTIYVLDGGISRRSKKRIRESCREERVEVRWLAADLNALDGLPVSQHVSLASYMRLMLPRLLPDNVARVIYLDCDLVVLADISELWDAAFEDRHVLAVQDVAAPYMCSSIALGPKYQACCEHISSDKALLNYRELGLPASAKYFNSGVLVINLRKWRDDRVGDRAIQYIRSHREHIRWWDQDGLNALLVGKWKELDLRWNQGARIYRYPSWDQSPFDKHEYEQIISEPYIVHFTMATKPWHYGCAHPATEIFFNYLDMTEWAGWRPRAPRKHMRGECVLHLSGTKRCIARLDQRLRVVARRVLPTAAYARMSELCRRYLKKVKSDRSK